ncbi:MAG: RNA polymerase sigma factor [Actinomycetota bacterium]|nr:RNA polymerase sigma factor [Actinomycetota bacterium]
MPATLEVAPPAVRAPLGRRVSDEALVARVRQGDDRAFERLFERYHPQLRSFCAHMLRDRDDGEDAVQQAFISALKDLRGSTKPVDFRPWIYQIARNPLPDNDSPAQAARGARPGRGARIRVPRPVGRPPPRPSPAPG